jgi:tRNA(fMet)-specific endonuclease VapC
MSHFLDTDTCIFALRGTFPRIGERLASLTPDDVKVPAIVLAELVCGALKSSRPRSSLRGVERLLLPFEVVPFCQRCAWAYGRVRAELEAAGTGIGPNDLVVAATVLANEGKLVTHNVREFGRIKGLSLQDWTE